MSELMRGLTVVVTGASSGIGWATARAFARRGANLVLAARRRTALETAAGECAGLGGAAVAVPADVTDFAQMEDLARTAERTFGGIDVWVNNAGVGVVGPFEAAPVADHARTVQVNLLGAIHGAYAALPRMLGAGRRGLIVNLASIGSYFPTPYGASYGASKAGLAAFTDALRFELAGRSGVEVCAVYPGFVDTPAHYHAANYTGRTLRRFRPSVAPEEVAERVVDLWFRPRRAVNIGTPPGSRVLGALLPDGLGRAAGRMIGARLMDGDGRSAPPTHGALLEPIPAGTGVRGDWDRSEAGGPRIGTAVAAVAAIAFGAALLARPRRAYGRG